MSATAPGRGQPALPPLCHTHITSLFCGLGEELWESQPAFGNSPQPSPGNVKPYRNIHKCTTEFSGHGAVLERRKRMSLLCLVLLEPILRARRVGGSQSSPALSKLIRVALRGRSVPPFILSILLQDTFSLGSAWKTACQCTKGQSIASQPQSHLISLPAVLPGLATKNHQSQKSKFQKERNNLST